MMSAPLGSFGLALPPVGASPRLALRVRAVPGAPVVSLRLLVRGGARAEAIPGQALICGRMLAEGTRRRDFRRWADDLESCGMVLAASGGYEVHGIALDALAWDWELALEWLAELIFEASFPEERCELLRRQAAAELESQADQADLLTAREFLSQLYAPHPRGRALQGDPESLQRLAVEDCARFHRDSLAEGCVLTVAGVIDEEAVARRVGELFADLAGPAVQRPEPGAALGGEERRELRTRANDQAHLYLGELTVTRADPDYSALELLGVILGAGAGLAGRIPTRIREREALAYSASAEAASGAGLDPGRLVCYLGTAPANLERAESALREELARLLADGLTDSEVADARSYLLGREPFRRETAQQWADLMASAALLGLPLDDPQWVTAKTAALDRGAVEAAARRHLDPARLRVTVGLPAE